MHKLSTVKITYKGNRLTDEYFNENPEIHHMYPTKEEFKELHSFLLKKARETNAEQVLEISENSIKINGGEQKGNLGK